MSPAPIAPNMESAIEWYIMSPSECALIEKVEGISIPDNLIELPEIN